MASSLSSALSSMEVMLDALMQRGIGKPEEKPKEEAPPALPTRPTVRGRLPSLQRPGGPAPWIHRPLLSQLPSTQEKEEEKCSVNLKLERRAAEAEEAAKQKDDDVRQKEEEIAALRQQIEHYESRLSECEVKMKSVEEELQKQITALQMAQNAGGRTGGSTTHYRRELSGGATPARSVVTRAEEASVKRQQRSCEPVLGEKQAEVDRLADEFLRESQAYEQGANAAAEARPSAKSVDELRTLKRQFGTWRKEYEARLRKTNAELKKRVHSEKSHDQGGHGNWRRCSWWRIKAPKCRPLGIKLPRPCSCCFRRCC